MQHLSDLLAPLRLPVPDGPPVPVETEPALVHELGAGLPAGHLHVWGGPSGAGKTAFLLALLHGAAAQGRGVVYASYDLPIETLALRLLAMAAGVEARALALGDLPEAAAQRAARVRASLADVPFQFLAARGLSVESLEDRLVRMPFRAEVLAVDFLQAVVREVNTDPGRALRDLSAVATRLHMAVVCAVRAAEPLPADPVPADGSLAGASMAGNTLAGSTARPEVGSLSGVPTEAADRVGWIAPATGSGTHRAEVLRNRYGERPAVPLTLDPANGALHIVLRTGAGACELSGEQALTRLRKVPEA